MLGRARRTGGVRARGARGAGVALGFALGGTAGRAHRLVTDTEAALGAAALDFACGEAMRASSTFILARLDNSRSFPASS